jgi:hypothetical protein
MKRIVCLATAVTYAFVVAGCGHSDTPKSAASEQTSAKASDSSSGCRFATVEEMSQASGEKLDQTKDRGADGCIYRGENSAYVELTTFPAAQYESKVTEQSHGGAKQLMPVNDVGIAAVYVSPDLFVKVDDQHAFKILKAPQGGPDPEIAVAKVIAPRLAK